MKAALLVPTTLTVVLTLGACSIPSSCEPAFKGAGYQANPNHRAMVQGAKGCHWSHSATTPVAAKQAAFSRCTATDTNCQIVAVDGRFIGKTAAQASSEAEQLGREAGSILGDLIKAILSQ